MGAGSRVALITGCGKRVGIGGACARRLASMGVIVAVSDIEGAGVEETDAGVPSAPAWAGLDDLVREIETAGGTASAVVGDISDETDVQRLVDEVVDRHGRVDILVNNAAAPHGADRQDVQEVPTHAWDLQMDIGARGTFLMCRAVVPHMRAAGWGRIVNISSGASNRPSIHQVAYAATKSAVDGLTRALALDVAAEGITVNSVLPGQTRTSRSVSTNLREFGDDMEAAFAERSQQIPARRFGTVDEIAAAVAYFISEDAGFTTGQCLAVDGGREVIGST